MLNICVLTPNSVAAEGIEQLTEGSGVFKLVFKRPPEPVHEIIRAIRTESPVLVLLDVADWVRVEPLAVHIKSTNEHPVLIGFAPSWTPSEEHQFAEAGIRDMLRDPFSAQELEAVAYEALHRDRPVSNNNILAFLPAKAGGGCSTVALNTAAALANTLSKKVLLVDADRRSGVLSILLNLGDRPGLSDALQGAPELTLLEWRRMCHRVLGLDVLAANPLRPGPLPSWSDFYQLLRFLQNQYDYVFFDLPELVNQATAEIVRSARAIFIVCTPEVPSLRMASQRSLELRNCEIPSEKIHIVLNRWERGGLKVQDVEKTLNHPVFAALPNDYRQVKKAILESRVVSQESAFANSCQLFAQQVSGLSGPSHDRFTFALLKKLWSHGSG